MQKRLYIQIVATSNQIAGYEVFIRYAAFVSNLFTFNLPVVTIKHTQKLLIEFSDSIITGFAFPEEKGQSIYTIQEKFTFAEFSNASPLEKKSMLTDSVYKSLLNLYEHIGLNSSDVELAYKQIITNHFILSVQLCGGVKQNKKGAIKASVTAEHFLDYALIRVTFSNDKNTVIQVDLFKTVPVYYIYTQLVNSAKWINNNVFAISNNSKEFVLNIEPNGSYAIAYNPKLRSTDGLKEEIKSLAKEILIDF
ncbi:hypothetical protein ACFQZI_19925 [Mucilaginibacter lutimaris]|uniref:DUF3037 domain-containing protein n=1 Tax=Mucilaginibacter lutimaris TaxID=931629 RepID=A0ABW2ZLL4_9SPHI